MEKTEFQFFEFPHFRVLPNMSQGYVKWIGKQFTLRWLTKWVFIETPDSQTEIWIWIMLFGTDQASLPFHFLAIENFSWPHVTFSRNALHFFVASKQSKYDFFVVNRKTRDVTTKAQRYFAATIRHAMPWEGTFLEGCDIQWGGVDFGLHLVDGWSTGGGVKPKSQAWSHWSSNSTFAKRWFADLSPHTVTGLRHSILSKDELLSFLRSGHSTAARCVASSLWQWFQWLAIKKKFSHKVDICGCHKFVWLGLLWLFCVEKGNRFGKIWGLQFVFFSCGPLHSCVDSRSLCVSQKKAQFTAHCLESFERHSTVQDIDEYTTLVHQG